MNIDIASVPELDTSIGMHGSVKQKETGGPFCLGVLIGIALLIKGTDMDGTPN